MEDKYKHLFGTAPRFQCRCQYEVGCGEFFFGVCGGNEDEYIRQCSVEGVSICLVRPLIFNVVVNMKLDVGKISSVFVEGMRMSIFGSVFHVME